MGGGKLSVLKLADQRRLGQGEEHHLFAGDGADIVMQAQHLDAGDFPDHFFHERPRRFDQMRPELLEDDINSKYQGQSSCISDSPRYNTAGAEAPRMGRQPRR
jgi:hypothetical protein